MSDEPRPARRRKAAEEPRPTRSRPQKAAPVAEAAALEPRPEKARKGMKRGSFLPERYMPSVLKERLRRKPGIQVDPMRDALDETLAAHGINIYEGAYGVQAQAELASYLAPPAR